MISENDLKVSLTVNKLTARSIASTSYRSRKRTAVLGIPLFLTFYTHSQFQCQNSKIFKIFLVILKFKLSFHDVQSTYLSTILDRF